MAARGPERMGTGTSKNLRVLCRDRKPEPRRVQSHSSEPVIGGRPQGQGEMHHQGPPPVLYDPGLPQVFKLKEGPFEGPFPRPGRTQELKNELREVREELKEKIEEIKQIKVVMDKDFEKLQEFVDLLKSMQQDMDQKMEALLDTQRLPRRPGLGCAPSPSRKGLKTSQMSLFMEKKVGDHTAYPTLPPKMTPTARPRRASLSSCYPFETYCEECSFYAPENNYDPCSK